MATTASRGWLTPHEITTGITPDVSHLMPFWNACYVHVPKDKRQRMKKKGKPFTRGEFGYFAGFQTDRSTTYRVFLPTKEGYRIVHSRNVEFVVTPSPHMGAPQQDMLEWNPHPEGELEDTAELEGVHRDKNTRQGSTNPEDDPLSPSRELPARERHDIIITEDCEVYNALHTAIP